MGEFKVKVVIKEESKRKRFDLTYNQLLTERQSFETHWRDLAKNILPTRARFQVSDHNKGDRQNQEIIDGVATAAARTLAAGMMSGVTSPARPWFRLTTPDPEINDKEPVKRWLHTVDRRMITVFLKSNLYKVLPQIYSDMGVFGTAAMVVEEDFSGKVVHFTSLPIGSYCIGVDEQGKVDVFAREFPMSVRQIIQKFGQSEGHEIDWSKLSTTVQNAYVNGQLETRLTVRHLIIRNIYHDPDKLDSKFKKYASVYYEVGSQGPDQDKFLEEKGYDYFPVLAPRWEVSGQDVYATACPGMVALGDIKALQTMQKRKAQAVEKMVNPPMQGPNVLRNVKTSMLPGDLTTYDIGDGRAGLRPIHEVNPRVAELTQDIQDTRNSIRRYFFEDLFLALTNTTRSQITATEVEERREEKLLALGPVLEQLNQDLLDPLIEIVFEMMLRQGQIPEAPKELEGMDLKVEYVSIMAQAQKMIGNGALERFFSFAAQVIQANPDSARKVNFDEMLDIYGDGMGIPPKAINSDEAVQAERQAAAQAQQAQMQAQMLQQGADAAQKLSNTDLSGDNALNALMSQANAGRLI